MSPRSRARIGLALLAAGAVFASGCAAAAPESAPEQTTTAAPAASAAQAESWPRTVETASGEVDIAAEPERIATLSTETSDIVLELIGSERVVAVSDGSVTPGAGNQLELAGQVSEVLPTGEDSASAEHLLALDPDLIVMTGRHDGEQDTAARIAEVGVPSIVFGSQNFATIDAVMHSVGVLGDALGAEEQAARIVADMTAAKRDIDDVVAQASDAPTVLLLMSRGGRVMTQPTTGLMANLVTEAGGEVVGSHEAAASITAEQVTAIAPEVILVEDFRGAGLGPFAELLEAPALVEVPAIAGDRVAAVSAQTASGTAGTSAVDGLREIATILHPDLFPS